jgi:hypothetical protein
VVARAVAGMVRRAGGSGAGTVRRAGAVAYGSASKAAGTVRRAGGGGRDGASGRQRWCKGQRQRRRGDGDRR